MDISNKKGKEKVEEEKKVLVFASGLQSSPFVAKEFLFPLSMLENFNYLQVEDNSLVSPL